MCLLSIVILFVERIRSQFPARSCQLVTQLPASSSWTQLAGPVMALEGRASKPCAHRAPIVHLADLAPLVTYIIPQRAFSVNRPFIRWTNKGFLGRSGKKADQNRQDAFTLQCVKVSCFSVVKWWCGDASILYHGKVAKRFSMMKWWSGNALSWWSGEVMEETVNGRNCK